MAAKLILSFNGEEVSQIPLERTVITIGRKHVNDVHLDNLNVSGNHAKVLTVGNDSFLEDLGSTNGTLVNGNPITKMQLSDQDVVRIGEYELRYINSVASIDDDMEKTVILQAGSISMEPPKPARTPAVAAHQASPTTPPPIAKAGNDDTAKLTVVEGPSKGKSLTLSKLITRVKGPQGQSSAISKKGDGYYLLNTLTPDLAPHINENVATVGSTRLNHGDIISMGSSKLKFNLG